jgi:hypothetical protein
LKKLVQNLMFDAITRMAKMTASKTGTNVGRAV